MGIDKVLTKVFGSSNQRYLKTVQPIVEQINALEPQIAALSDASLAGKTNELRKRYAEGATLDELLSLYQLLVGHAGLAGAQWVVIEIADGLLQPETAALLQCRSFRDTVEHWVFATSDPLAAEGGVRLLRKWDIEPIAVSGIVSMSPLAMREAQNASKVRCLTAKEIQCGELNKILTARASQKTNGHSAGKQLLNTVFAVCAP